MELSDQIESPKGNIVGQEWGQNSIFGKYIIGRKMDPIARSWVTLGHRSGGVKEGCRVIAVSSAHI
jgi:hypothetical protein